MSQSDQITSQMETIFASVAEALKQLISRYRDLQQSCREKIVPFDDELFGFCDDLDAMRRMIGDEAESLTVRVNCVADVIDFINDSFQDIHGYLDTLESSVGIKREDIISDIEWHALKKPDLQFYLDKKAELESLMSQHPELSAPELKVTSSWQNMVLKPYAAPAMVFVVSSLAYLFLSVWNASHVDAANKLFLAVFLLCFMSFLAWISQANDNLRQEKITGLEFTPSWCILSFFVPVLFLYWPYQAVVEIWKASSVVKGDWKAAATPLIIPAWWLSFVVAKGMQLILLTSLLIQSDYLSQLTTMSLLLDCIATVLAIIIVLVVSNRQAKEFKQLS